METLMKTPRDTISIRPAQTTDVQAFRSLRLEALHNHPESFSSDYVTNREQPLEFWVDKLHSLGSESMIFFATHNDRLIGMCGIVRGNSPKTNHGASIWGVYVQPEWRDLHIAEGLINICIEWARERGIKIIRLAVVATNAAAIRCYSRCGFTIYGVDPQAIYCDGKSYDELLMVRLM